MSKYLSMHITSLLLVAFLLLQGVAEGSESTLPTFTISAELSRSEVLPGAPLYVYLTLARDKDVISDSALVSLTSAYGGIKIDLAEDHGEASAERLKETWYPPSAEIFVLEELDAGESLTRSLILHRWVDTDLTPGPYVVRVNIAFANFRMESDRETQCPVAGLPVTIELPLTILPPDDTRVSEEYAALLALAVDDEAATQERLRAFDTLIIAQGPLALPYQLKLVEAIYTKNVAEYATLEFIWTMFRYIAHSGDANTARVLIEFAAHPEFEGLANGTEKDVFFIWHLLSWSIHELHRLGDSETRKVTHEFSENSVFPKPFRQANFMDGGSHLSRNY